MRNTATILFLVLALQSHASGGVLDRKVSMPAQNSTPLNYVAELLALASIGGGIEDHTATCEQDKEVNLAKADGSLEEALIQLRTKASSVRWHEVGGELLVTRGAAPKSLLDARVSAFTFDAFGLPDQVTGDLLGQPEIKRQIAQERLALTPPELGFAQAKTKLKKEVTLRHVTLREALTAISRSSDHPRVWLFQERTCSGQTAVRIQWVVK